MSIMGIAAAFSGGIFGALIGGTVSFIFTGILALMGIGVLMSSGDSTILDVIAFGPFFGPHIAFAGGVAASTYAGMRRSKLESQGIECYKLHPEGYDCTAPNYTSKEFGPLIVGGVFGILGYIINDLIIKTGIAIDTIALAVAISGALSRMFIAKQGIIGDYQEADYEISMKTSLYVMLWGTAAGLLTAIAAIAIDAPAIGWAISATSLLFIYMKVDSFPVSHHITMVAGVAAVTTGSPIIGAIAGGITGIVGEFVNKYTNSNVRGHLDMPAVCIAIGTLIVYAIF